MIKSEIILKRKFNANDLQVEIMQTSNRVIAEELEMRARQAWGEIIEDAKAKGVELWDGEPYRLDNLAEIREGNLNLKLSTIKFSTMAGYIALTRQIEITEAQYTNHISTAGLIKTRDGLYVFGIRGNTYHNSKVDFIGGGLNRSEIIVKSGEDIATNLIREMKEEANIEEQDIALMEGLGILLSDRMNVLIMFEVELKINQDELQNIFRDRLDHEMAELVFVKEEELERFLKDLTSYRPLVWDLL